MKREHETPPLHSGSAAASDGAAEIRMFSAWMGLVLVAFGVAIAGYMFYRIGQVVLDPRGFETQVDRWEFVVRGRTSDHLPEAFETPERTITPGVTTPDGEAAPDQPPTKPQQEKVEEMAQFVGRVASKSARPAALFLLVLIITIMVRLAIAIINAGIRLVYVTAGEKDFMKRVIEELVEQRNRPQ